MPAGEPTATPLDLLRSGVESYAPYLQASGELHDPVFGEPTQYGTAYHALCNATLAVAGPPGPPDDRVRFLERATRGLDAALTHTADPSLPAAASGFSRETGAVSHGNHRDFTWPPILKTYRILRNAGIARADEFAKRIADVDIMRSFRSRPPSNWASVWLSGEWIRIREGLSPHSPDTFDDWLGVFFERLLHVETGFYHEPGTPNSYDLFTRYHLADLLAEEYDGRRRADLGRLMVSGLERSLAVQLSDGSLASAHRSAGQTWTLGAQIAYFTHAASHFSRAGDAERTERASAGARLAFASMRRWQRADGPFSPVENVLPPGNRVGYEGYTADGHYANLALAFLGVGVLGGFTSDHPVPESRPPLVRVEHEPTFRGVAHAGPYSLALTAHPAPRYDGFGVTDVTFGPDRFLHFASSVRHLETGHFVNLGLARRTEPGRSDLDVMAQRRLVLTAPIEATTDPLVGLRLRACADEGFGYELAATVGDDGVRIEESTPGVHDHQTLLVPYLRDPGTGVMTQVTDTGGGVLLSYGDEQVSVTVEAPIESRVHLPCGFENRRGLCGLVRLDVADPRDRLTYRVTRVR